MFLRVWSKSTSSGAGASWDTPVRSVCGSYGRSYHFYFYFYFLPRDKYGSRLKRKHGTRGRPAVGCQT